MRTDVASSTVTLLATPMQEALWWVHQRARNKSVYNITWRMICDRAVDPDALAIAWQAVVDRHDCLRTSIVRPGESVQMVVHPHVLTQVRQVEVDAPAADVDIDILLRLIAEEAQEQETVLEGESLARLTTVRVADRHEMLLTVHHLVLDGWGMQLLMDDLSYAYAAAAAGQAPKFDTEATPFQEYAAEQHTEETRARWQPSLDHWRNTLEGAVATTVAASSGEFIPGAPGTVIRYSFSESACSGIAALASRVYATPFAIFQAAMHIVLARGGAGPDVSIGAVLANRMSARDQALVGYTANLCISRAHVPDTDRVIDVVTKLRDSFWVMMTHQAVPYPLVFGELSESTQRALTDDTPLGLSHLGPIGAGVRLGDVGLTLLPSPNRAARADIATSTWEAEGRYHAEVEFNTSRYSQETVEQLLSDLDTVLAVGGAEPEYLVGSFQLSSRAAVAQSDHAQANPKPLSGALPESAGWQLVTRLWTELLGAPPVGPDANFFNVGGHSLTLLRLTAAVEEATGAPIDIVEWLTDPTPSRLVAQLGGESTSDGTSTVVTLREGSGTHLHLLCGAGGTPNDFREVVAALPSHWKVTASRELEPLATVPAMAARFEEDLAAAGLRPTILCGWSMGGLVAYEMASKLTSRPALVLLDSPPPTGFPPEPQDATFAAFATAFVNSVGGAVESVPRTVGDTGLRAGALAACLTASGQAVSATALAQRWVTYFRHTRSVEAYVGPGHVPVPALIVGADLDDAGLQEWARRVSSPQQLRVNADHYGVLQSDAAVRLAAEIDNFDRANLART